MHLPDTGINYFMSMRISKLSTNSTPTINKDSELMWFWPVRIDMNWTITWKAQSLYPTHDTKADSSDRECWGFCVGMPGSIQVQYFPAISILIGSTIVQTSQFTKIREIYLLTCIPYHVEPSLQEVKWNNDIINWKYLTAFQEKQLNDPLREVFTVWGSRRRFLKFLWKNWGNSYSKRGKITADICWN